MAFAWKFYGLFGGLLILFDISRGGVINPNNHKALRPIKPNGLMTNPNKPPQGIVPPIVTISPQPATQFQMQHQRPPNGYTSSQSSVGTSQSHTIVSQSTVGQEPVVIIDSIHDGHHETELSHSVEPPYPQDPNAMSQILAAAFPVIVPQSGPPHLPDASIVNLAHISQQQNNQSDQYSEIPPPNGQTSNMDSEQYANHLDQSNNIPPYESMPSMENNVESGVVQTPDQQNFESQDADISSHHENNENINSASIPYIPTDVNLEQASPEVQSTGAVSHIVSENIPQQESGPQLEQNPISTSETVESVEAPSQQEISTPDENEDEHHFDIDAYLAQFSMAHMNPYPSASTSEHPQEEPSSTSDNFSIPPMAIANPPMEISTTLAASSGVPETLTVTHQTTSNHLSQSINLAQSISSTPSETADELIAPSEPLLSVIAASENEIAQGQNLAISTNQEGPLTGASHYLSQSITINPSEDSSVHHQSSIAESNDPEILSIEGHQNTHEVSSGELVEHSSPLDHVVAVDLPHTPLQEDDFHETGNVQPDSFPSTLTPESELPHPETSHNPDAHEAVAVAAINPIDAYPLESVQQVPEIPSEEVSVSVPIQSTEETHDEDDPVFNVEEYLAQAALILGSGPYQGQSSSFQPPQTYDEALFSQQEGIQQVPEPVNEIITAEDIQAADPSYYQLSVSMPAPAHELEESASEQTASSGEGPGSGEESEWVPSPQYIYGEYQDNYGANENVPHVPAENANPAQEMYQVAPEYHSPPAYHGSEPEPQYSNSVYQPTSNVIFEDSTFSYDAGENTILANPSSTAPSNQQFQSPGTMQYTSHQANGMMTDATQNVANVIQSVLPSRQNVPWKAGDRPRPIRPLIGRPSSLGLIPTYTYSGGKLNLLGEENKYTHGSLLSTQSQNQNGTLFFLTDNNRHPQNSFVALNSNTVYNSHVNDNKSYLSIPSDGTASIVTTSHNHQKEPLGQPIVTPLGAISIGNKNNSTGTPLVDNSPSHSAPTSYQNYYYPSESVKSKKGSGHIMGNVRPIESLDHEDSLIPQLETDIKTLSDLPNYGQEVESLLANNDVRLGTKNEGRDDGNVHVVKRTVQNSAENKALTAATEKTEPITLKEEKTCKNNEDKMDAVVKNNIPVNQPQVSGNVNPGSKNEQNPKEVNLGPVPDIKNVVVTESSPAFPSEATTNPNVATQIPQKQISNAIANNPSDIKKDKEIAKAPPPSEIKKDKESVKAPPPPVSEKVPVKSQEEKLAKEKEQPKPNAQAPNPPKQEGPPAGPPGLTLPAPPSPPTIIDLPKMPSPMNVPIAIPEPNIMPPSLPEGISQVLEGISFPSNPTSTGTDTKKGSSNASNVPKSDGKGDSKQNDEKANNNSNEKSDGKGSPPKHTDKSSTNLPKAKPHRKQQQQQQQNSAPPQKIIDESESEDLESEDEPLTTEPDYIPVEIITPESSDVSETEVGDEIPSAVVTVKNITQTESQKEVMLDPGEPTASALQSGKSTEKAHSGKVPSKPTSAASSSGSTDKACPCNSNSNSNNNKGTTSNENKNTPSKNSSQPSPKPSASPVPASVSDDYDSDEVPSNVRPPRPLKPKRPQRPNMGNKKPRPTKGEKNVDKLKDTGKHEDEVEEIEEFYAKPIAASHNSNKVPNRYPNKLPDKSVASNIDTFAEQKPLEMPIKQTELFGSVQILGWDIPVINWSFFTDLFHSFFAKKFRMGSGEFTCEDSDDEETYLRSEMDVNYLCGDESDYSRNDAEGQDFNVCNMFCSSNGFFGGVCLPQKNCLCYMTEEKKFGIRLERLPDYSANQTKVDDGESACHDCRCLKTCRQDYQKFVGYCARIMGTRRRAADSKNIGSIVSSCHCGVPWHNEYSDQNALL